MKILALALAMVGLTACNTAKENSASVKNTPAPPALETKNICGYFNDASGDPDYNAWVLSRSVPSPGIVPSIGTPVERFYLIEKKTAPIDFKSYELHASGENTLVIKLRGSVINLMETGKQYCVNAEVKEDTQLLIHSARVK